MTWEKVLELLNKELDGNQDFEPNSPAMDALNELEKDEKNFEENFKLVAPVLEIIGTHPNVYFGMPGGLVHFVERYSNRGYEELLIQSVAKTPTPHNIWMLHRCYNDPNDNQHDIYKQLIDTLRAAGTTPEEVKKEIDDFDWD